MTLYSTKNLHFVAIHKPFIFHLIWNCHITKNKIKAKLDCYYFCFWHNAIGFLNSIWFLKCKACLFKFLSFLSHSYFHWFFIFYLFFIICLFFLCFFLAIIVTLHTLFSRYYKTFKKRHVKDSQIREKTKKLDTPIGFSR